MLDLTYDFQIGHSDNGNVYGITNNKATARSQTFNYDYLNRLKQAWTSNSTLWGTALDQYAATLALWFGVPPSGPGSINTIFPNLPNFSTPRLGFLG